MSVMTPTDLRSSLRAFLGEERFRKFVAVGFRKGRLRFWQEREWRRFLAADPRRAATIDQLREAIHLCHVHGQPLQPDTVPVFHGHIDHTQAYRDARERLFPHAVTGPVASEGRALSGDRVTVWFCPACRAAKAKWTSH